MKLISLDRCCRWLQPKNPISPPLANLYMRRFVLAWKQRGLERSLGSRIVNYADDLVILCKHGKAEEALRHMREIMGRLKLAVNEEKTRVCKVPEETFDFLGYTFGQMCSMRTGQAAKQDVINYIEMFYKGRRLHSYLGYVSPAEYEKLAKVA